MPQKTPQKTTQAPLERLSERKRNAISSGIDRLIKATEGKESTMGYDRGLDALMGGSRLGAIEAYRKVKAMLKKM